MGNTASVHEKIFKSAKEGDFRKAKAILDALAQSPQFRSQPGAVLDVTDPDGNTALLVAVLGSHFHIAELLIQRGASLHVQNARSDGGSALHEAVNRRKDLFIDLLLRSGANPFVENVKGFTAMDFACQTRNTELLRRMEILAPWRGWLQQKVNAVSGPRWQRRWVVICHRLPSPLAPPNRRARVSLLCYDSQQHTTPECRVWLDGARAEETPATPIQLGGSGGTAPRMDLKLHHRHSAPSGCFVTGDARVGYTLYFRPDEGALGANENLRAWAEKVNERHQRRGSQQPAPPVPVPWPSPLPTVSPQPSSLSSGGIMYGQQQQQQPPPQPRPYPTPGPAPAPTPAIITPPSPPPEEKEEKVCCMCLDAPADHGFLHNDTMHLVVCGDCADNYKASGRPDCPFCRQPYNGIIRVF